MICFDPHKPLYAKVYDFDTAMLAPEEDGPMDFVVKQVAHLKTVASPAPARPMIVTSEGCVSVQFELIEQE